MSDTMMQNEDGTWTPSIPEPLWVRSWLRWRPSCCRATFRERSDYVNHYVRSHLALDVLRSQAWRLVHAQGRMLDNWAEADDAVKRRLWRDLHTAGDQLRYVLEEGDR